MADFQAQIFLRGQVTAEVPSQWVDAVRVIKPTFADYFPGHARWKATYLPVYAVMRALFQSVYLQSFFNPFLAALTILALYGTVRNIWPNEKQNALARDAPPRGFGAVSGHGHDRLLDARASRPQHRLALALFAS